MLSGIKSTIGKHSKLIDELELSVTVSKADRINIKALETADALSHKIPILTQDKANIHNNIKKLKAFYHSGLMGLLFLILDSLKLHKAPAVIAYREVKKIEREIPQ